MVSYDIFLLVTARTVRLFSYGWLALALMDYLEALGFSTAMTGALFTATLVGDLLMSLMLTTTADTFGRKRVLIASALLKILAGAVYASSERFWIFMIAGIIGVISPSGSEIGPFMAVEQSALTEEMHEQSSLTWLFSIYNFIGYAALAAGGFVSGWFIQMVSEHYSTIFAYRMVVAGYGMFGVVMLIIYFCLSNRVEPLHPKAPASLREWFGKFGLHRASSRAIIFKLSCLFTLDAFGGGFALQTIIVYWFNIRWDMDPMSLGYMISMCNVFSGVSAMVANPAVARYGAINTMVFSHLPSNVLLLLVPFMPTKTSAIVCMLARFTLSQMDVPSRQLYVTMVVDPDERSAANGITSLVRSIGVSASPLLAGYMLRDPKNFFLFGMPFVVSGGLKIIYDILLYVSFRMHRSDIGKPALPTGKKGTISAASGEGSATAATEIQPLLSVQPLSSAK